MDQKLSLSMYSPVIKDRFNNVLIVFRIDGGAAQVELVQGRGQDRFHGLV